MCLHLESVKRFGLILAAKLGSVDAFWHLITLLENKMHHIYPL